MKFTISWLKKYLELDIDSASIINGLNKIGFEVEEVINQYDTYKDFIIAEIVSAVTHPEADKLRVCQVNNGKELLQIVCGAPNARAGIKVVLAPIGVIIPANNMKIKQSKIRNVESNGMLCSSFELGLSAELEDGIMELGQDYVIGSSFADACGLNETLIEISITPNRGDCLGVYGIARDLAAAGFGKLKKLEHTTTKSYYDSPVKVEILSSLCPKYIGRHFRNLTNKQSPDWLQKDLKAIGLKPISALVDITNYFTFAFGRPMHVFDADLISSIKLQESKGGEIFTALNDKEYKLKENSLIITDQDKVIGLAGIIGEKISGVSESTKNIFLEIGLFDADNIANTSRSLQIESDAKFRFERKIDPEFMEIALNLASSMILEICGGEASYPIIIDNLNYQRREIDFSISELKKRIGIEYDKQKVINILNNLGFIVKDHGDSLLLNVPSWRHDIYLKEHIVGEVARIDGFDNIKSVLESNIKFIPLSAKQKINYRISRFAASLGLDEVITMSFMNSKKAALFTELNTELFLKNPISSELDYMRPSILPNLLEAAENNQSRAIDSVGFFEMSSIYRGIKPEDQIMTITGLRTGFNEKRNHYQTRREVDVFDIKADIFNIISEIGFDTSKLQYDIENLPKYYHPQRSSALRLGKNIIGYFGQIHPQIIQNYNLDHNAVAFELFIENIPMSKAKFGRRSNISISDFQQLERDFAFIMDKNIAVDSIIRAVLQIDKQLIKEVNIFDVYSGKNIEEGKKSVAFSVLIQADNRTLTELEIENLSNKIISSISNSMNAILRNT